MKRATVFGKRRIAHRIRGVGLHAQTRWPLLQPTSPKATAILRAVPRLWPLSAKLPEPSLSQTLLERPRGRCSRL